MGYRRQTCTSLRGLEAYGIDWAERKLFVQREKELISALRQIVKKQSACLNSPFQYRMVSQAQAAPVERAYFLWDQSKKGNPQPVFDAAFIRAAIYNQSSAARQLEAFVHVSRTLAVELSKVAIHSFEVGEVSVPFMALRGLIERIAHIGSLADEIKDLRSEKAPPDRPSMPLINLGDRIGKALYGTKVDWKALCTSDLRNASKNDLAYFHKVLTMNVSARSVLSSIDKLERRIPGIRVAYEVLCEFLHPNVGDLYSATVRSDSELDEFGTRHVVREIGLGPKDLSTTIDLQAALAQVLEISCDAIRLFPELLENLENAIVIANAMARKSAHRIRKNYRELFGKGDLCPCLSGLKVRYCK